MELINLEKEERLEYVVTTEMKKIWSIELELLKKVLDVCNKYNLKIFADSGTLLGAIRHNGFIPWDDDIDLAMLRKDYNKLVEISEKEFDNLYFFQTEETDPGSSRGHIQIRKSDTTGILYSEKDKKYKFNQGIFIDIFPLDAIPNNKLTRIIFLRIASLKKKISNRFRIISVCHVNGKGFKRIVNKILNKIYAKYGNIFCINFEKYIQKYNNGHDAEYIANIALNPLRERGFYKKEYYDKSVLNKFEGIEIPVPVDYEKVLDELFNNWRIPQKVSTTHGEILFDTEKSYKEYLI